MSKKDRENKDQQPDMQPDEPAAAEQLSDENQTEAPEQQESRINWEELATKSTKALMEAVTAQNEAEQRREEMRDSLARLQAEFQNYRKRTQEEKQLAEDEGFGRALTAMLPVIDNLYRALAAAGDKDAIHKGVQMCLDQFFVEFGKRGMKEIEAQDQPFDPGIHNAVMQEPCDDEEKKGTVSEVMQPGYKYKDRVLRYSSVKVYV